MQEIMYGLCYLVILLYLFFCMFLTCVAKPSDCNYTKRMSRWHFKKEPTGFILVSRWIGNILIVILILGFIMSVCYGIGCAIVSNI